MTLIAKHRTIIAMGAAALAAAAAVFALSFRRPDIILVTFDSLRADHLDCYGYPVPTAPSLAALAARGVLFEKYYTTSCDTLSATPALLTGRYMAIVGVDEGGDLIAPEIPTLPVFLAQSGYATVALIANGMLTETRGFTKDFGQVKNFSEDFPRPPTGDAIAAEVKSILAPRRRKPVFIWIHYFDPHSPYRPGKEFVDAIAGDRAYLKLRDRVLLPPDASRTPVASEGRIPGIVYEEGITSWLHYVKMYDAQIRSADYFAGRLAQAAGNALLIMTSDHGEGMGEHGCYFTHGANIHDELLHVPLIITGGNFRGGRKVREAVSSVDLAPTILAAADPSRVRSLRRSFDGLDLRRFLKVRIPRSFLYSYHDKCISIRDADRGFKLIVDTRNGRDQLYALPDEDTDLSGDTRFAGEKRRLRTELSEWMKENPRRCDAVVKTHQLTEHEKERIKSLGYGE